MPNTMLTLLKEEERCMFKWTVFVIGLRYSHGRW